MFRDLLKKAERLIHFAMVNSYVSTIMRSYARHKTYLCPFAFKVVCACAFYFCIHSRLNRWIDNITSRIFFSVPFVWCVSLSPILPESEENICKLSVVVVVILVQFSEMIWIISLAQHEFCNFFYSWLNPTKSRFSNS